MVSAVNYLRTWLCFAVAAGSACAGLSQEAENAAPLIDRLDPQTRAKVILALAGLAMLGLLLMGLTWLAFRTLRRQFRRTDEIIAKQQGRRTEDDWAKKPLVDPHSESNQA